MEPNYCPTSHLLHMVELLDRCKCELCQNEKRRIEDKILSRNLPPKENAPERKTFVGTTFIRQ